MKPELLIVDDIHKLLKLQEYLLDKDIVAYDCETTGLTKRDEVIGFSICAEEGKAFYVILAFWVPEISGFSYPGEEFRSIVLNIIKDLKTKKLVMHNSVFDCYMAEAFFKVDLMPSVHTDTMILAHLLNENRKVGLKELASELFGEDSRKEQEEMKASVILNGGKLTKTCYEMYKADPYLMASYGAKDALLTYKLFITLVPELYEQGLDSFFYDDESMPLLRGPTYQLNSTGLQVDTNTLTSLKAQLTAECLEAKSFIYKEIDQHIKDKYPGTNSKNTFNIGSSSQLSWLLFGKCGLTFNILTNAGKDVCRHLGLKLPYNSPSLAREFISRCEHSKGETYGPKKKIKDPWAYIKCDKEMLKKIAPKLKWVDKLLEYQRKMKLLNTYVKGIESRVQYGTIQPSFLQHGTTSGRYSSRNPNFQNLPRDDKRIKACIVARPGKVFVGADYSQLEPRIFAYYSNDSRLLNTFRGTDDFYSVIGMEVYDKKDCTPNKEGSPDAFGIKYKRFRDLAKTIALASTYGATAHQLSKTTGKNIEDTQKDIDSYFEKFPGVANMMKEAHSIVKKTGSVANHFGRPRRIPEAMKIDKLYPADDLPYQARNLLNLAVNHRIQSTGASIVNRAAIKFVENCRLASIECRMVCQVHDSIIIECLQQDSENVSLLLQDAMENTVKLEGINLEAIPKIGKSLAEV